MRVDVTDLLRYLDYDLVKLKDCDIESFSYDYLRRPRRAFIVVVLCCHRHYSSRFSRLVAPSLSLHPPHNDLTTYGRDRGGLGPFSAEHPV